MLHSVHISQPPPRNTGTQTALLATFVNEADTVAEIVFAAIAVATFMETFVTALNP